MSGLLVRATSVVVDLGVIPASDWFPLIDDPQDDPRWPLRSLMRGLPVGPTGPGCPSDPGAPAGLESATSRPHASQSAIDVVRVERSRGRGHVIELDSHHGGRG